MKHNISFNDQTFKTMDTIKPDDIGRDFKVLSPNTMAGGPVVHPAHYNTHPSGVECLEIVRWLPFNTGNAVKYIWRCGEKGKPVEDLRKAIFYLEDEIKRIEAPNV